jgi:uncharacterized membrane protein YbhN (UPF0104 family)
VPAARTRLIAAAVVVLVVAALGVPMLLGVRFQPLGLLEALLGSALLVCCSTLALNGSRPTALPVRRAVPTVLATTAANAVTPAGVGGALVTLRVHRRSGLSAEEAVAAAGMRSAVGALVAMATTAVLASTVGVPVLPSGAPWLALGVVAAMLAAALAVPRLRGRAARFVRAVGVVARRPRCCAMLVLGCAGVTAAQLLTLHGAVTAVGVDLSWATLLATLMGSAAARSAVPSPGGVGPIEAALVGGLTAVGIGFGTAAAAVAVYRTAGHWLPVLGGLVSLRVLRRAQLV